LRCVGGYWHLASFRCAAKFVRYWTKSGQRSALALNGSVAIDPERTPVAKHLMSNSQPEAGPAIFVTTSFCKAHDSGPDGLSAPVQWS
jgi:hypothetical protein